MRYRSIIVCLDDTPDNASRLEVALALATCQEARLTGMYHPDGYARHTARPAKETARRRSWACSLRSARRRYAFLDRCSAAGVAAEWLDLSLPGLKAATKQARLADLVIMGQPRPRDQRPFHLGRNLLEHFLLDVGRPILVTPGDTAGPRAFNCVAVAWDGSREAARAVADALPVLEQAGRVIVLRAREAPARFQLSAHDLRIDDYLTGHGIPVEIIENIGACNIGDWLLARASETDVHADLLVAGAYGSSRLGERLWGGVTHTLLQKAKLPLLMSH